MKIGISACLLGDRVRYDGKDKRNDELIGLLKGHEIIRICPEVSAGFPIPRNPIEILNGKVIDAQHNDLTEELHEASMRCFEMIEDCDFLILKSRSPSCGYGQIYDGTFSGYLITGNGIFTRICLENNMTIYTEEDIDEIRKATAQ